MLQKFRFEGSRAAGKEFLPPIILCFIAMLNPCITAQSSVPKTGASPAYIALKKTVEKLEEQSKISTGKEKANAADSNRETAAKPGTHEIQMELAHLYFYLGRFSDSETDRKLALSWYEKGEEVAKEVLGKRLTAEGEFNEEEAGFVFWWAANLGYIADIRHNLSSLKIVKDIEHKMLQMREELPEFAYGGPDRVLGKMYLQAPSFVSIGSKKKAEMHLKRAFSEHPEFPGNLMALASFYYETKDKEKALKLIAEANQNPAYMQGDYGPFNVEKEWWRLDMEKMNGKGATIE